MLVLAIDAATLNVSLALGEGEPGALALRAESEIAPGTNASERLPGALLELLAGAGASLDGLDAIAVGTGPGSLTGLRVALASAKGIAFARRIPVVGISSLLTLAQELAPGPGIAAAVVDARRGELYAGLFRRHADRVEVLEAAIALPARALAEKLRGERDLRVFGPAVELALPAFAEAGVPVIASGPSRPSARAMLQLVTEVPAFDANTLFALEPRYVRAPESEWTIKPKKAK